jgi:high affinity Mn2+ porin
MKLKCIFNFIILSPFGTPVSTAEIFVEIGENRTEAFMNPSSLFHLRIRSLAAEALALLLLALAPLVGSASAQERSAMLRESDPLPAASGEAATEAESLDGSGNTSVTVFPHSLRSRWWVSAQTNVVFQFHPAFRSPYSGANSLQGEDERSIYHVNTVFLGYQLPRGAEALFNFEWADGHPLSEAAGLAGVTNAEIPRDPAAGAPPRYVIRGQFHQVLRLSAENLPAEREAGALATTVPARRLEFRVGSMVGPDLFDASSVGSNTQLQFLNWTIVNNGAYDYTGHTRGYTYGAVIEYQSRRWGFRFGEMLMAKSVNGDDLDWDLGRTHSEHYELELRPELWKDYSSTLRLLAFQNHARMGNYREALARFNAGLDPQPMLENTRRFGRMKYGFGINAEQELPHNLRAFLRLGWNEGNNESYAYAEVNSTVATGADLGGAAWNRKLDRVGAAVVTNGISADHQAYLRNGGLGFQLGDGNLKYGRETIFEVYYTAHLWRGVFVSADFQRIWNPGYNRDRGPVLVPGLRLHVDY